MSMVGTVEGGAHPVDEFRSWQDSGRLDHSPFAVHPLGFDGVQPRTLDGQVAGDDPHAVPSQLDLGIDPVRWTFLMSRAETRENVHDDSAFETLLYPRVQSADR